MRGKRTVVCLAMGKHTFLPSVISPVANEMQGNIKMPGFPTWGNTRMPDFPARGNMSLPPVFTECHHSVYRKTCN